MSDREIAIRLSSKAVVHARLRSLRFGIRRSQTVFISPQTSPCLSPHAIPRRQLRENTPHCAAIPGDRGRIAMRIISRPNIYCIPPISGRNIIGPLFHPGIHRVLPMLLSLSAALPRGGRAGSPSREESSTSPPHPSSPEEILPPVLSATAPDIPDIPLRDPSSVF